MRSSGRFDEPSPHVKTQGSLLPTEGLGSMLPKNAFLELTPNPLLLSGTGDIRLSGGIRYPVRVRTYNFPKPVALAITRMLRYWPSAA